MSRRIAKLLRADFVKKRPDYAHDELKFTHVNRYGAVRVFRWDKRNKYYEQLGEYTDARAIPYPTLEHVNLGDQMDVGGLNALLKSMYQSATFASMVPPEIKWGG